MHGKLRTDEIVCQQCKLQLSNALEISVSRASYTSSDYDMETGCPEARHGLAYRPAAFRNSPEETAVAGNGGRNKLNSPCHFLAIDYRHLE